MSGAASAMIAVGFLLVMGAVVIPPPRVWVNMLIAVAGIGLGLSGAYLLDAQAAQACTAKGGVLVESVCLDGVEVIR